MKKLLFAMIIVLMAILGAMADDDHDDEKASHRVIRKFRESRDLDHTQKESPEIKRETIGDLMNKAAQKRTFKIAKPQEKEDGCKGGNCNADNYDI